MHVSVVVWSTVVLRCNHVVIICSCCFFWLLQALGLRCITIAIGCNVAGGSDGLRTGAAHFSAMASPVTWAGLGGTYWPCAASLAWLFVLFKSYWGLLLLLSLSDPRNCVKQLP